MIPAINPNAASPQLSLGMAHLTGMAFRGENMTQVALGILKRVHNDPDDAAALLDLGTVHILLGQMDTGLMYQRRALEKCLLYRDGCAGGDQAALRLLAIAAPGDLMANVPISFLLQGSDVRLDLLFVVPGADFPPEVPDHDLAIVIAGESDANRSVLERIAGMINHWPRQPVLNDPMHVMGLSRHGVAELMADAEGICIPPTVLIRAEHLRRLASGDESPAALLRGGDYPLIVRPRDSHAGKGLEKIDDAPALGAYLAQGMADEYYLSTFVDYSGADGQFRKYRIAVVDGRPMISHMAVSSRWMVHYLNADMKENAAKRAEEGRAFASFDSDFADRHKKAFKILAERIGLEYFAIDGAETRDGRLMLFEVDTAMIVHAMDSPEIYPYKPPQMRRIFRAFQDMLYAKAGRPRAAAGS